MPLTMSCAFLVAASVAVLDPFEELLDELPDELLESEDEEDEDDEEPSAVMLVDDDVELSEV
jgi:hypothetical protein